MRHKNMEDKGKKKSDSIRAQFAREMKITDPADYEEKKTLSQSVNDSTHREGWNARAHLGHLIARPVQDQIHHIRA